jgi:hypothetical protein
VIKEVSYFSATHFTYVSYREVGALVTQLPTSFSVVPSPDCSTLVWPLGWLIDAIKLRCIGHRRAIKTEKDRYGEESN